MLSNFTNKKNQDLPVNRRAQELIYLVILGVLLIVLCVASLTTGVFDVGAHDEGWEMYFITRVPRTAALLLSASAMSVSGLVMQMITQNRFVEPTTSGTLDWAGLGLMCAFICVPQANLFTRTTIAILFSCIGSMIFITFLHRVRMRQSIIVAVIGIMMGSIISAFTTYLGLAFGASQSLEVWFSGTFATIERGRYEYLWFIVLVNAAVVYEADRLSVMGLGKAIASNLGVNYNRTILLSSALVSIACGIVATVVGYLPFLGLIIPNLISMLRGDNVRSNLVWICGTSMCLILCCDLLSRTIIFPFEVPVSLILGTLGAACGIGIMLYSRSERRL